MIRPLNPPANEVFVDEHGFVRIIYRGDQDKASMLKVIDAATELLRQKLTDGQHIGNVLADVRSIGKHTPTARQTGLQAREAMPFHKIAILVSSADPYTEKISKIMTSMSSRKKEIGYFKTEARAIKWLSK